MTDRKNILAIFLMLAATALSAEFKPLENWEFNQEVQVKSPGLTRFNVPMTILDKSHSTLKDMRFLSEDGSERPFALTISQKTDALWEEPIRNYRLESAGKKTIITLPVYSQWPADAVILQSPKANFLKTVDIESSDDGRKFKPLVKNQIIFREAPGVENLKIKFPKNKYSVLRAVVYDNKSKAIPFTGGKIRLNKKETAPMDIIDLPFSSEKSADGNTTLHISLPARNLTLGKLEIIPTDSVFRREVTLLAANKDKYSDNLSKIRHLIFKVDIQKNEKFSQLDIPIEKTVRSKNLIITIFNGNSPPLKIRSIKVHAYPVAFLTLTEKAGAHYLLTGNPAANKPAYDLKDLVKKLKGVKKSVVAIGALNKNPNYVPAEFLAELSDRKSKIDISNWKYRKEIKVSNPGIQRLALDLDVLSAMASQGSDLRIVADGWQFPYLYKESPDLNSFKVNAEKLDKNPSKIDEKTSVWKFELPVKNIYFKNFSAEVSDAFFNRDVKLYEENSSSRSGTYLRQLSSSKWAKESKNKQKIFSLNLNFVSQSKVFYLAVSDGDNPPLNVSNFKLSYQTSQLFFKGNGKDALWLYYGNKVKKPQYDIGILANAIWEAEKEAASLGEQEELRALDWWKFPMPEGFPKVIFWIILGLVVLILIVLIARLLPESEEK